MTIQNFSGHLKMRMLQQGTLYFNRQKVLTLKLRNSEWTSTVKGRELYEVQISMHEESIESATCECIAYSERDYCKHVVAVLLAIQQKKGKMKTGSKLKILTSRTRPDASSYEARARNGDVGLIEQGYTALTEKQYAKAVEIALSVIATAPRPVLGTLQYKKETAATKYIIKGFELLLNTCKTRLPQNIRQHLYQHAVKVSLEPQYKLAHYNPHWIEILETLGKGNEKQVLRIINRLLIQSSNPRKYPPNILRLLKIKLRVLVKMGRGAEVTKLLKTYKGLPGLRDTLIEAAEEINDRVLVKQLARESLHYYKGYNRSKYCHFRETGLRLAQKYNDKALLRELSRELYKETNDVRYYRLIKNA